MLLAEIDDLGAGLGFLEHSEELVRGAAGPQEAWYELSLPGCWRWKSRHLGCSGEHLSRGSRTALLEPQNGQRAGQAAQEAPGSSQEAPAGRCPFRDS